MTRKYQAGLAKGKILLAPFDTVWGLAADARNEKAVKTIFEIKKRDFQKPLSVLAPDLEFLYGIYQALNDEDAKIIKKPTEPVCSVRANGSNGAPRYSLLRTRRSGSSPKLTSGYSPCLVIEKIKKYLPGNFTVLIGLRQKPEISPLCFAAVNYFYVIGVRLIDKNFTIQKICEQFGAPLTATSANLSGEKPILNLAQAEKFYLSLPNKYKSQIVLVNENPKISGHPSILVDLTKIRAKKYIRD